MSVKKNEKASYSHFHTVYRQSNELPGLRRTSFDGHA